MHTLLDLLYHTVRINKCRDRAQLSTHTNLLFQHLDRLRQEIRMTTRSKNAKTCPMLVPRRRMPHTIACVTVVTYLDAVAYRRAYK